MSSARRQPTCRAAALLGGLLPLIGCAVTIDNDNFDWGNDPHSDRWYTGGARFERPVQGADDGSLTASLDALLLDVAQSLPSAAEAQPGTVNSVTGVFGIQVYTPEDTETSQVVPDDRPYAGWVYAGVVRSDTWLDPDPLRRHDRQSAVELDVGLVGPVTHVDELQDWVHGVFDGTDAQGWHNQLDNEPGVVLRAIRRWRLDYAEFAPGSGLAYDFCPRVDGALGNIDTHAGVGGVARLGLNLSRGLDPLVGDPAVPESGDDRFGPKSSLYLFGGVDGCFVIHNLFLDGNTLSNSESVTKERLVGEAAIGIGWDWGSWRIAYSQHFRTTEFEGQDEDQNYGSLTVAWIPRR